MNNPSLDMEEILRSQITGFHQYALSDPVHLIYASENLCQMLGLQPEELLDAQRDLYALWVHPADRGLYARMLQQLSAQAQALTESYRLLKKDGSVIFVRDTVTSSRTPQGELVGVSVLTDITDLQQEKENLRFLQDTIPCGFLRYTCEKQPKITYINQKMLEFMRFPAVQEGELDDLELYKSNIFLMIPMEERRRFSKYLNRVYSSETPIAGEMTLLRCDGTRAHIFGWVSKCLNEQGEPEFQIVCMDITERYQSQKARETKRYLKALTEVYDKIFEFNLDANTVKCLHCNDSSSLKHFEDIAMQMEDALEKWLPASVAPEHQDKVRHFFQNFCQKRLYEGGPKPPQITYQARSSQGSTKEYTGVFIQVDEAVSFYCCRELHETADTVALKNENDQLKEGMRDLVLRFSDGIAAFELSPEGLVKPLYASENVCAFFGYSQEEWLPLTARFTPLKRFVGRSEATYEAFSELLKHGEAEFTYFDYATETQRKIRAICSQREALPSSPRYVMLYSVEAPAPAAQAGPAEHPTVFIRTFGYFDVFVGEKPIAFRNKKSKELFALLVDRRGGYITSEEAISFLWGDEPANAMTLSRYRKVALRLKNTLEEYGISQVIETVDGKRRIVMEAVQCDLYQYLSGREEYAQLFKGSFLTNYSWSETTLGELISGQEHLCAPGIE